MSEPVSLQKLYNEFKKSPYYKTLSYPYFKFLLMGRLEKLSIPGKSMEFTFNPGRGYYSYFRLKVNVLDILKAMKISKKEFLKRNMDKGNCEPGVLDG